MTFHNPDGIDPTVDDVMREALAQDKTVEIQQSEWGVAIVVDGELLIDGLAWESFNYPLHRGQYTDSQRATISELVEDKAERSKRRRKRRVAARETVQSHAIAEGQQVIRDE